MNNEEPRLLISLVSSIQSGFFARSRLREDRICGKTIEIVGVALQSFYYHMVVYYLAMIQGNEPMKDCFFRSMAELQTLVDFFSFVGATTGATSPRVNYPRESVS